MPSPLARALTACALARVDGDRDALIARFEIAVARMDEADRTYRSAIEAALAPDTAHAVLEAMRAFRSGVAAVRERARNETGYGDFDPLDTYVPAIAASHAHAVRAANAADLARSDVAERRAQINAHIGGLLEREDIERLTNAKRARNAAFDRAVRDAVPAGTSDQLATHLLLLADGWY